MDVHGLGKEVGEGRGGRREGRKGREEPGQVLRSSGLLHPDPAVNRQAEEGWTSGDLFCSASHIHVQPVPASS